MVLQHISLINKLHNRDRISGYTNPKAHTICPLLSEKTCTGLKFTDSTAINWDLPMLFKRVFSLMLLAELVRSGNLRPPSTAMV